MKQLFPLILAIGLFTASPAWALKISLLGGANLSKPELTGSYAPAYKEKEAFGAGALLEFGMLPAIGLEFGALYLPRKFEYTVTGGATPNSTIVSEFNMMQFPVLLRATLGGVLSIGVGGYYARYPDAPKVYNSINNELAHSESDYGVATSLALYMPFSPLSRFMIDGRYNIGVKDNMTGIGSLKYTDMQVLVGLQLGM
jgi:hypothetical protein